MAADPVAVASAPALVTYGATTAAAVPPADFAKPAADCQTAADCAALSAYTVEFQLNLP
jgi:hypothetical protein